MPIRARIPSLSDWRAQVKCQAGCPVATDSGRYVQLIAEGRDEEAFLVARAPNPFASVCGRVCAAPCEDACRRGAIDAPVSIRALKRFVTERYGVESIRPQTQDRLFGELVGEGNRYAGHLPVVPAPAAAQPGGKTRVAVVGAGPAGLSAAHDLALIDDLLATAIARRAHYRPADDGLDRRHKLDRLQRQQFALRHDLVGGELGEVMALLFRRVCIRPRANVELRRHTHGAAALDVDKGGGNLAEILDAQGAMADRAACRHFDAVGKTAVCFNDDEQPFVIARNVQAEGGRAGKADARPEHLARAEV